MKKLLKKFFPILISLVLIGVIVYKIDFNRMILTFRSFDMRNLAYVAGFYILSLYLRGMRWKYILVKECTLPTITLSNITTIGSMINTYIPARAGDIWRAFFLGNKTKLSKTKVLGSIVLERLFDGLSIFCILLAAVLIYYRHPSILTPTYLIGAAFFSAFIIFYLTLRYEKIDYICEKFVKIFPGAEKIIHKIKRYAHGFIEGFSVFFKPDYCIFCFFLSLAIWVCEVGSAYIIINSFGFSLPFSASLFVISFIAFGTMIPSSSIFLGPYQYAYILALGIYGVPKSTALAIAVVHQAVMMGILTLIGLGALFKYSFLQKNNF